MNTMLFIGPNEVEKVEETELKTPRGAQIVKVVYKGDRLPPQLIPRDVLEAIGSTAPKDYNHIREKKHEKLLETLVAECLEADVACGDVKYVAQTLSDRLFTSFDRATNLAFGRNDKEFVPGANPLNERTLLEANEIITRVNPDGTLRPR